MVSISSPKFSTPDIWLSARRKSPSLENILLTSRSNDERTDKRPGHKTSRPASQERPVLGHRGHRSPHDSNHVAHWREENGSGENKRADSRSSSAGRGKRNQDRGPAKTD